MREYQYREVTELAACVCDRCGRRMSPGELGEWQERLSIDHLGGFESVFGDGNTVHVDLCQHCVQEVLGPWLRITPLPAGAEFPPQGPAPDAFGLWGGKKPEGLAYEDGLRGSVLRYDASTKPVDVEWEAGKEKPLPEFDAAPYLDSEEAIAAYLIDSLEANDAGLLSAALGDIARARGMTEIAKAAGITRDALYKALRPGTALRFDTLNRVCAALGVETREKKP